MRAMLASIFVPHVPKLAGPWLDNLDEPVASGIHSDIFSSSSGPAKATINARANLGTMLEKEHDDVPCPECNWHQTQHIAFVRSQSQAQLKSLAGAFFIIAGLALGLIVLFFVLSYVVGVGLPTTNNVLYCSIAVLVIASPGILLRGLRSLLLLRYNPNSGSDRNDPE